jgi:hypothetical protein
LNFRPVQINKQCQYSLTVKELATKILENVTQSELISPRFREGFRSEYIHLGVLDSEKPLEVDLERFFAILRFEQRGKYLNQASG